jgi:hypothetical protein
MALRGTMMRENNLTEKREERKQYSITSNFVFNHQIVKVQSQLLLANEPFLHRCKTDFEREFSLLTKVVDT